ncbi:MAG: 6-phosphogluconolactonase [Gammaproteobacteria bacterium]
MTIRVFTDLQILGIGFAERWIALSEQAIAERGQFHVALTGGSTPRHLYETLARPEFADRVVWQYVHIYFGDERCVPPDHTDSNFRMANETLLRHIPIPAGQIHRMQGELPDAHEAARAYAELLVAHAPKSADGNVQFDLVLLGLGPDGHIASLFLATPILQERKQLAAAVYVEKLDSWRISVTLPVINNARQMLMLATGVGKAEIVKRALASEPQSPPLPVQMLAPAGTMDWYLDADAAQLINGHHL